MNKAQLIDLLAQRMDGDKRAASAAVEGVVDIVVRTVQAGENVTITGFGVFERRSRAARVARNPRTGQTVHVAPTSVPSFRPGTTFKAVVSGEVELTAGAPAVKRSASAATRTRAAGTTATARKAPAKKAPATTTAAKKAPATTTAAKKAPATKAPARAAVTRAPSTSAPKTAAAKTAAKAAAASAPPKAPKVEKPAKGKKVDGKKKPKSKK